MGWDIATEEGVLDEPTLLPRKNDFFHLKWRVLMHSERYLLSMPSSETMLNLSLEVM